MVAALHEQTEAPGLPHHQLACRHRGAAAIKLPRKNGKHLKGTSVGAAVRAKTLRSCRRLGRTIWKRCTGCHRRSLVEAKMHCHKPLAERFMHGGFDRQVARFKSEPPS